MNMLTGAVVGAEDGGGMAAIRGDGWQVPLSAANSRRAAASSGDVVVGVRHNHVKLAHHQEPGAQEAKIYTVEPTGDITFVHLRLGSQILIASVDPGFRAQLDETVWISFDQEYLHLFDARTEAALPADETARMPVGIDGFAAGAVGAPA
jgi:multiple sugar transport system ATP-binding protein